MLERFPLSPVDNPYALRLQNRGFQVVSGFNEEVADALHEGSKDPEVAAQTRDTIRFRSAEAVVKWHDDPERERVVYSLIDTAVQGVIWFGAHPDVYSDAQYDFAIRLYGDARGKGLAGDFLEAAHDDFVEKQGGDDTWLRVLRNNEGAKRLYLAHRYQITHQTERAQWMVRRARRSVNSEE